MSRVALSILRQAAEPMTSKDIALEMLITRASALHGFSQIASFPFNR